MSPPHLDVFQISDTFLAHAIKTHGDEVGIIAYYGSYALGNASPTSDLDLIFIPDEGKEHSLFACFVLHGISFDFFPISWQRAERLANGVGSWAVGPSLIAQAKPLYVRSERDRQRFEALQERIIELQSPACKNEMVQRALDHFPKAVFHLGNLRLATMSDDFNSIRKAAWQVIMAVVECLALVNQHTFQRGWDSNFPEILQLPIHPANLEDYITTLATAEDAEQITQAAELFVKSTREILCQVQKKLAVEQGVSALFTDYYPELHDKVNKIVSRAASGNPIGASWAATFIQDETTRFIASAFGEANDENFNLYHEYAKSYQALQIPELIRFTGNSSGAELAKQALQFDQAIQHWLQQAGVALNQLNDLDSLTKLLEGRVPYAPPSLL